MYADILRVINAPVAAAVAAADRCNQPWVHIQHSEPCMQVDRNP